MGKGMSSGVLQSIVEDRVRTFFEAHPLETFEGHVSVDEVIAAVRLALPPNVFRLLKQGGLLHDAIRLLGPTGENDVEWLRKWGGDRIEWVCDRGTTADTLESTFILTRPVETGTYLGGRMI